MDVVGLVSGGKDSCYNLMSCVAHGHRVIALANLYPPRSEAIDSYMYQSVGAEGVELYGEAMDLPLYRREIKGTPANKEYEYETTEGDEVEDLYELLLEVKRNHPTVKGVSSGAILSSYQKQRVENICARLDLVSLAYLWERDQQKLLHEMIENKVNAILIKVAAVGLKEIHLGQTLAQDKEHLQMEDTLLNLRDRYGVHPCGEGGEYESFVLDCPLFKRRIEIEQSQVVRHQDDIIAPVLYLRFLQLKLVDKV